MHSSLTALSRAAIGLLATALPAAAQFGSPGHTDFSDFYPIPDYPNAQQENLTRLYSEAEKIVQQDLAYDFTYRCLWSRGTVYPSIGGAIGDDIFIKPRRVFDDVYFVGYASVSAWAIDTGDGLIIIDSLYNEDEIERILVPGLQAFGFEMSDVKALLVTHEHIDHYGGRDTSRKSTVSRSMPRSRRGTPSQTSTAHQPATRLLATAKSSRSGIMPSLPTTLRATATDASR